MLALMIHEWIVCKLPKANKLLYFFYSGMICQICNSRKNKTPHAYGVSIFRLLTMGYYSKCPSFNCIMLRLKLLRIKPS